jgi:hypothetical protein
VGLHLRDGKWKIGQRQPLGGHLAEEGIIEGQYELGAPWVGPDNRWARGKHG